jgi:hypothetical protein
MSAGSYARGAGIYEGDYAPSEEEEFAYDSRERGIDGKYIYKYQSNIHPFVERRTLTRDGLVN